MGMLLFDAFTLLWAGVLIGLISPSATRGLVRTIGIVLILPWIVGLFVFAFLALIGLDWLTKPAHPFMLSLAWIISGIVVDASLCLYCGHRLGTNFRHLVSEQRPNARS
jgi:hypothetical protein